MLRSLTILVRVAVVGSLLALGVSSTVAAQDPLADARDAVDAARERVDEAQQAANEAGEAYFAAEHELEEVAADIARLEGSRQVLDADLAQLRSEVRDLAVAGYVRGERLPTVLADADITRAGRVEALTRIVNSSRADALDAYRVARDEMAVLDAELADRRDRQSALVQELDAAEAAAFDRLDELGAELAGLEAELDRLEEAERIRIAEEQRRLEEERRAEEARLAEEQRRLEEERLAEEQDAAPAPDPDPTPEPTDDPSPDGDPNDEPPPAPAPDPAPPPPGGWVCPVAGPHNFIDSWGAPRAVGRWHKGTDMMAAEGTPVVAVLGGFVEHRGNSVGGLSAHLTTPAGEYFYYTHLSGYETAGQVAAGTVIGYVGSTGNATTPHLHFEYHPNGYGSPVNPYPTLIQFC